MNLRNKLIGLRALWPFDNRWQLIFERIFFVSTSLSVYRKGDLEFLIDHDAGDHNGTRLCLISDIYTRFLPRLDLGSNVRVFDLGANGGGFPLLLVQEGITLEKVICVEMNPNTFRRLHYNISRNIDAEHRVVAAAVCGERRQFQLNLGRGDISDSIYHGAGAPDPAQRVYDVAGRTFDELFQNHFGDETVDLCKMDIEGAEYEVLASPAHQKLRNCRYLIVEMHPTAPETLLGFERELNELGFTLLDQGDGRIPGERLYQNQLLKK